VSRPGRIGLKTIAWGLCLTPLAILVQLTLRGELGANPISYVTNWLGQWTFRMLLATLALTPIRIVTGAAWPVLLRRLVGLFTFFYAGLHFLV
jgi:sulfoxide reductase heme-binding subunit YedZ